MGFCTKEQHDKFLQMAPFFEKSIIVDNGIIFLKYWLEVGDEEQEREKVKLPECEMKHRYDDEASMSQRRWIAQRF